MIKSIKVTRTMEYSPDAYLEYCNENDETPTQDGFMEFIEDWIDEDFRRNNETEEIEEIND